MTRIVLLNTSILTAHGCYKYEPATVGYCREMLELAQASATDIISAIGHESTAEIMTSLLNYPVKMNRIQYRQEESDIAIVFKMNGRPPEGQVLSRPELEKIGFEFGILKMMIERQAEKCMKSVEDVIDRRLKYVGGEMTESQKHMKEKLTGFKFKADFQAAEKCGYTLSTFRRMLGNMCQNGLAKIRQEKNYKVVIF